MYSYCYVYIFLLCMLCCVHSVCSWTDSFVAYLTRATKADYKSNGNNDDERLFKSRRLRWAGHVARME